MIYRFLKILIQIAIRVFYKNVTIHKEEEIPDKGAIIAVGNHPNTFMDPLIVASIFNQQVGFLGNASIFVHPIINTFFRYFRVIKVYREKDVPKGERMDNTDAFRESHKYLNEEKTLLIFPEGNSYRELKLRKIKTGAARIALNTEKKNDYKVGVKIIPFGLNYSSPGSFRSKLTVNIGKPILVSDYIEQFKNDNVKGVKTLTNKIKTSLEDILITANDEEHETLFVQLKQIYKRRLVGKFKRFDNSNEEYRLTKELSKSIQYFKISRPEKYQVIKGKIEAYILLMKNLNLKGSYFDKVSSLSKKLTYSTLGLILIIIGFPFYLFGLAQNYTPFIIPYWVAKKITPHIEYHAPIMMTIGIFLFPFYYYLSIHLFTKYIEVNTLMKIAYIASLPLSGYFCLLYVDYLKDFRNFLKFNPIIKSIDIRMEELLELKKDITLILDDARSTYLKRL